MVRLMLGFGSCHSSSWRKPLTRAVPCMRRAEEFESYDPQSEYALAGDEEGWVATHSDPANRAEVEDIPNMGGPEGGTSAAGRGPTPAAADDDDDIPDINELELQAEEDEVRVVGSCHCGPL